MSTKNQKIAEDILQSVGGKDNVTNVLHCMTRLRLSLKDLSIPNIEEIKQISGVLGCQNVGGQFQIIIGQNVPKVYDEFCKLGGFSKNSPLEIDLEKKEPFQFTSLDSWKKLGNNILDGIVGCLTPVLPVLIAAGLIKMIVAIIGPGMLNLVSAESDIYQLFTFVGDAGFYFFPVFIGYSGAKKFGANPILGLMMGCVLLHPSFIEIVNSGKPFTVYGIPMIAAGYSSSVLPMILITYVMSHVERFVRKISPDAVSTMLVPTLTILIMLPISLCALGPLGTVAGQYLSSLLISIRAVTGPFGVALIGALFLLIVATGMHLTLISVAITTIATVGYDNTILVGSIPGTYAIIAIGIAVFLKSKDKETKSVALSTTISQALGGVGEPIMYGIIFRFKRLILVQMVSTFIAGLWLGFTNTAVYFPGTNNLLVFSACGKDIVNGVISCVIAFVIAFALVMIFGYESKPKGEK